jgi:hypothetical protein
MFLVYFDLSHVVLFKQFSHLKNQDFFQIFIINNLSSFIHCCHWCPLFEISIIWFLIEAKFQTFDSWLLKSIIYYVGLGG